MADGITASSILATRSSSIQLKDRVAIVTGGFGGIGQAVVTHLASLGAKLVISDLVTSQLTPALSSTGAVVFKADISDPAQVKALFDFAETTFNTPPHILVNCAGVSDPTFATISTTSLEIFDHVMSTNTNGSFLCCREAANRMRRGSGGRIICVTSSQVGLPSPGYGPYTMSKAAVEVMVKILAKELKGTGITANCVAPGPIATKMFFAGKTEEMVNGVINLNPLNRLGQPEDVAPVIGFLASDSGEWINGQIIRVNGGYVV
uniref:NADPH-dependent aldehyde reductase-like protein, chloroplastic n=1 Tax=Erigeron canadensis TaxID=72917 RepID=UPI001CB99D9A|nr:NADPH-dependent aldehyde reductase-like protein, chloroplastic [Erigeron canadensis]